MLHSILPYGCEIWPVQVADKGMLAVFNNEIILRILHVKRRDYKEQNSGAASTSLAYRRSSSRAGSAGLVTLRDVLWEK